MLDYTQIDAELMNWMSNLIRKEDESSAREKMNELLDELVSSGGFGDYWQSTSTDLFIEIVDHLVTLPEILDADSQEDFMQSAGYAARYEIENALDGRDDIDSDFRERILSIVA